MNRIVLFAILVFLDLAEHDVRNLIAGMRPDIDDFIVPLAIGDDAAAILLINLFDLLVGVLEFQLFTLRNNHVLNPDRDAGTSCFLEPELFQFIQRGNSNGRASDLIAAPNDVAELFLARCFIEETKFFRPNLIENDAPGGCLDYTGVGISKISSPPAAGVFTKTPINRFDLALDPP